VIKYLLVLQYVRKKTECQHFEMSQSPKLLGSECDRFQSSVGFIGYSVHKTFLQRSFNSFSNAVVLRFQELLFGLRSFLGMHDCRPLDCLARSEERRFALRCAARHSSCVVATSRIHAVSTDRRLTIVHIKAAATQQLEVGPVRRCLLLYRRRASIR
jgi:hypothetical protein